MCRIPAWFLVVFFLIPTITLAQGEPDDWPTFVKHDGPQYSGQFFTASDVTVLREGDGYRMTYTCMDFLRETPRAILCAATSPDGLTWTPVEVAGPLEGLILRGREGSWEENLEGSYLFEYLDQYLLYYSGYQREGHPALGYPARLSVAASENGVDFERIQDEPILEPTRGWYDNDAIYSPVVFLYDEQIVMIYVGHCYTRCEHGWGTTLLAATSSDGIHWTKRDDPVLQAMPDAVPWTRDGVAEPAIVFDPDGRVTLFFTSVNGDDRWLGMARGESPFGPWDVNPNPILQPTPGTFDEGGVLAPHVLIEDGIARMWYLGVEPVDGGEYYHVGYAEAVWDRQP